MYLSRILRIFLFVVSSLLFYNHPAYSQLSPHFCKESQNVGRLMYACSVHATCQSVNEELSEIDSYISGDSLKSINQNCARNCSKLGGCQKGGTCLKSCKQSCVWETLSNPLMSAINSYHSDCRDSLAISKCASKEAKPFCNQMKLKDMAKASYVPRSSKDYARIRNAYKKISSKYRQRCRGIEQEVQSVSATVREIVNTQLNCEVLDSNYNACSEIGFFNINNFQDIGSHALGLVENYRNAAEFKCKPTPTPAATPQPAVGCKQAVSCSAMRDDIIYTDLDGKACYCDQVCCTQFSDCCSNFTNECSAAMGGNACMLPPAAASFKSLRSR